MTEILQWAALVVCGGVALGRLPDAARGRNRSIFGAFLLAAFAILLSIDGPYLAVDAWLGGENYANLILRFFVYGAVVLVGYRTARAFDDRRAVRRIAGPAGLAVLGAVAAATTVFFLLADTSGSATGLGELPLRSPSNAQLIGLYATAGRAYPAFVAACLLPSTVRATRSRLPAAVRAGALLLSVGCAALVAAALYPLLRANVTGAQATINFTAVLGMSLGLATIWLAGRAAARSSARPRGTAEPGPEEPGPEESGRGAPKAPHA
ncbi:hypothetical protein [Arthrobacter sp. Soil763]|uniref:hypothetical protein n=1 Tax=Arthrobacter sp. Soil763 TaxID=1736402 RepID=UPI0006F46A1C|nr:hypothetical protein [Arthrobacter sp. Soil763]KRE78345.1 hypothetical protein ASG71_10645 [Arthrobacter sp. Soil763]